MNDAPPTDGIEALLTLLAFLVVMLVVPWILAWDSARLGSPPAAPPAPVSPAPTSSDGHGPFSSRRERRLWLWTLAVMAAIYLTLSPAQQLAATLRERNLLGLTTGVFLLAVGSVIAFRWARTHPGTLEIGAAVGVAAVYLTTLIRLPVPEARSHLFEYGLVAMLVYQALLERRKNGRRVPVPAVLAVVITASLGWVDEAIQYFLPNRVYDLVDVGFNALAGFMAVVASVLVGWARRWDLLKHLRRG